MKYFSILLILFCLSHNSYSQDSDTTLIQKKNLIGLNLSPLVSALTGARIIYPFSSVQYKRVTANGNFRSSLNYSYAESYGFFLHNDEIVSIVDTTLTFEKSDYNHHEADLRLGWEVTRGKNKLRWIFGGDLVTGLFYRKSSTYVRDKYGSR